MPPVTITQADSGSTVTLAQGGSVQVSLPENPSTGFRWAFDGPPPPSLTLLSDDYTSPGTMPGAGGTRTLSFQADSAATSEIKLKLWREWEGDASVTQRFAVTVVVR